MANFMKNLSRDSREYLEMSLLDKYEDVAEKQLIAQASAEEAKAEMQKAKNLRQQAMAKQAQLKTLKDMLDKAGVDEATQKSKTAEWSKTQLKELFGIELP